ncbi:FAD assembly factor SdhE [Sideroxydans lithotrophicus]|uniref:FAD assembly factor SdhE n=1 Tax=Sideroxydans lithotrophicus (strain ES-1) TaxID=580332 RepID=D5CSY0_SIDLE|nr:succinate dehydrogenase assembly factor 2 [Sideroxydans lithotrophicus]ADE12066.1 protein of unknown function DUF339 [Sideroxydans lithotrophicus ES-1]
MRKQDTGNGIREGRQEGARASLTPVSRILDPEAERRLLWRCRRGLLELDIVLGRFIERYYPTMDDGQRVAFDELLDLPDTELWDLITGKTGLTHAHQGVVLEWLKDV